MAAQAAEQGTFTMQTTISTSHTRSKRQQRRMRGQQKSGQAEAAISAPGPGDSTNARRKTITLATYAPVPKQQQFHEAGREHRERMLKAGNQVGKTTSGGAEVA